MAAQKGANLKLKRGDGGSPEAFTLVASIRSKSHAQSATPIDVTTDEDVNVSGVTQRTFVPGTMERPITASGVTKTAARFQELQADFEGAVLRNYQLHHEGVGQWQGGYYITGLSETGEVDGVITFEVTLSPSGVVTWTPEISAPTNALLPSIAGVAQVGQTLTAIPGLWNNLVVSYTYQWQANSGGGFANISGATARTYVPIVGQIGQPLRCVVTAVNAAGSASANTASTANVIAA